MGSKGQEDAGPAFTSLSVRPSPGVAVRWPAVEWGPNLGGVRGVHSLGQLAQLCDQYEQEIRVEAPRGAHAARHSQHLPKGTSGLQNKWPIQAQRHQRQDEDKASDTGGTFGKHLTQVRTCCPQPAAGQLFCPPPPGQGRGSAGERGQSPRNAGQSYLQPAPPAQARPHP